MPRQAEKKTKLIIIIMEKRYHYRANTTDDVDTAYQKIKSVLIKPVKKTDPLGLCVVATEIGKKSGTPHIHALIITTMSQKTLRARLLLIYPSSGKSEYCLEYERTDHNLSYIIKGGIYRYCPEMAESIKNTPQWVFKDQNIASYEKSYALLKEDYLTNDMSDYEFIIKLLDLYAIHHKHIYISHIRALWLGVANQRNKALNYTYRYRVEGNARPFRHRLVEEIMRGFFIYDN